MISTYASGTQSTNVGSEDFLSSPNVQGVFFPWLDLNALLAGDVLEARLYGMGISGGTSRVLALMVYNGAQPANKLIVNPLADSPNYGAPGLANSLTDTNSVRFSISQTFGSSRSIPWRLDRDDGDANLIQWRGSQPNVLISGRVDANTQALATGVIAAATFAAGAIDAAAIATDAIGSSELAASAVSKILTSVMTEAYSAVAGTVTLAQFVYEVLAMLQEFSISGTTLTTKKRDQSTTAETFTLNDATNPTALTRAT